MDPGKTCGVHVRRWCWQKEQVPWELWIAQGPLTDWSSWDNWGGDSHCLWQRVYPGLDWDFPACQLRHQTPPDRRWQFDAPNTTERKKESEETWCMPRKAWQLICNGLIAIGIHWHIGQRFQKRGA